MKSQLDNFTELMTSRADYKRALERILKEDINDNYGEARSWKECVNRIRDIAGKALKKHG